MGGINKREHIIKKGQELIWKKGYESASVKDITTAAKLPKGSFYHYFESKEKFALEAMEFYLNSYPEEVLDAEPTMGSFEDLIDARIETIQRMQFTKDCFMSVMIQAYQEQDDEFREAVLQGIDRANQALKQLLETLQKKRIISEGYELDELIEFIDFSWRGARMQSRIQKSDRPLFIFKNYLSFMLQQG